MNGIDIDAVLRQFSYDMNHANVGDGPAIDAAYGKAIMAIKKLADGKHKDTLICKGSIGHLEVEVGDEMEYRKINKTGILILRQGVEP